MNEIEKGGGMSTYANGKSGVDDDEEERELGRLKGEVEGGRLKGKVEGDGWGKAGARLKERSGKVWRASSTPPLK